MFKGFYGLTCNPFDKEVSAKNLSFVSHDFKEMTDRLNFVKEARGIGVFTAPPGYGKTFALRRFAGGLNPNLFHIAYICLSTVSIIDFYRQCCDALHIEVSNKKSAMFRAIQERIYALYKEKRRPLILAVDEAHELNSSILNDLKMIMNHDFDSLNCFTLLLIGEPHLNSILLKPVHEALRQRITVHYSFEGLTEEETGAYIRHKLSEAGCSAPILDEGVIAAVHGYSQGNPRQTDSVMSAALTLGAQLEKKNIDTDVILAAVNNLMLA
jgi:type II secretory pathway predicted ATPase ExeA